MPSGRAGATMARGGTAITGWENPALLADARGPVLDLELGLNLTVYEVCVQRFGTYGDHAPPSSLDNVSEFGTLSDYADEPYPRACADGSPGFVPYIASTVRVHERVGIGFGVLPPLGLATARWGGAVTNADGELRPQPNRYSYIARQSLLLRGYVSVGVRVADWLRVGAGFIWAGTVISTDVHQVIFGGEVPSLDLLAELRGADRFMPGVLASVHANPTPNLDVALFFQFQDASRADATLDLTSGIYGTGEPGSTRQDTAHVEGVRIVTPQPRELRLSVRYADRREALEPDAPPVRDPLRDERWDVELMLGWTMTRHIDDFRITVPEGHTIDIVQVQPDGSVGGLTDQAVRTESIIDKGFRDQLTVGLGADYALVADVLALRVGFGFETGGMRARLVQTDFLPAQRFTVHAGLTARAGHFDFNLGYTHVFQEDIVAEVGTARLAQNTSIGAGRITNAGRYSLRFDALSLSVALRL